MIQYFLLCFIEAYAHISKRLHKNSVDDAMMHGCISNMYVCVGGLITEANLTIAFCTRFRFFFKKMNILNKTR